MNFAEFQLFRDDLSRARPDVLDCGATNLYSALARLIPPNSFPPKQTIHRCHLATEWATRFGFNADLSRRALVSSGVRDSLALLFRHKAREHAQLWLPSDNYPVYGELACAAGLVTHEFATLPEPVWPAADPVAESELILLTNPLKPLGRWLTEQDVAALTQWLRVHPGRRLLLDAVYNFDTRFHSTTLQLLETQQTILLHSLTKGWLHPRLFGIALVPPQDAQSLSPSFRVAAPPQSNLARARELMAKHFELPVVISRELTLARKRMLSAIGGRVAALATTDSPSYLIAVAAHWRGLLEAANVLGIPASAFGSRCENVTILSTLSFLA